MSLQVLCFWLFTTVPSSKHTHYLPPSRPYQSFVALCLQFPVLTPYCFSSFLTQFLVWLLDLKRLQRVSHQLLRSVGNAGQTHVALEPRHWGQPEIILSFAGPITLRSLMLMGVSSKS